MFLKIENEQIKTAQKIVMDKKKLHETTNFTNVCHSIGSHRLLCKECTCRRKRDAQPLRDPSARSSSP